MPKSPGKAFPRTVTRKADNKQDSGPASAFQLTGQELSSARSCFRASSPDLTGDAAPCPVFSKGEIWAQESSLLEPCWHTADQELPARGCNHSELSELPVRAQLSAYVPVVLPANCSVMSLLLAGKHRVTLPTCGCWNLALVCNCKRPSWSRGRWRLQLLLLCRFWKGLCKQG